MSEQNPITERLLDDESAASYIRSTLASGRTLSRRAAKNLDQYRLEVTALVPAGVSDQQALDFQGSVFQEPPPSEWVRIQGGWAVPTEGTTPELAGIVHQFLEAGPDRIAVFEDFLSRPSHPGLAKYQSKMWFYGEEVYHYCVHGDSRKQIERAINESFDVVFFRGFLVDPEGPITPKSGVVAEQLIDKLGANTQRCIVVAYDGESYLLSRPAGNRSGMH